MNRKELWEDRMKFVNDVMEELSATAFSYKLTVGREVIEENPFRGLDGSVVPYGKEPRKKRRGKTVTFSKFYGALR